MASLLSPRTAGCLSTRKIDVLLQLIPRLGKLNVMHMGLRSDRSDLAGDVIGVYALVTHDDLHKLTSRSRLVLTAKLTSLDLHPRVTFDDRRILRSEEVFFEKLEFALNPEKRLQLLQEVVPGVSRVAVLYNPTFPATTLALKEAAAPALGLTILPWRVSTHICGPLHLESANTHSASHRQAQVTGDSRSP